MWNLWGHCPQRQLHIITFYIIDWYLLIISPKQNALEASLSRLNWAFGRWPFKWILNILRSPVRALKWTNLSNVLDSLKDAPRAERFLGSASKWTFFLSVQGKMCQTFRELNEVLTARSASKYWLRIEEAKSRSGFPFRRPTPFKWGESTVSGSLKSTFK